MEANPFTVHAPRSGDFRQPAAEESARIVAANGGTIPSDCSLCLRTPDGDAGALRRFGYSVVVRLVLGIVGLASGAIIAAVSERGKEASDEVSLLLILAGCCSVGGILILLSNVSSQRRFVRRQLAMRYDDLVSRAAYGKPLCVGVENADTFSKMKIVPEELGFLVLDPARCMLTVEGILHRYIVFGKDVLDVKQVRGAKSSATVVEYAIGETSLKIAIQYDSIWHEFKRQTIGAKDPLIARIRETLGLESG